MSKKFLKIGIITLIPILIISIIAVSIWTTLYIPKVTTNDIHISKLFSVETYGGMCPGGACGDSFTLYANGYWEYSYENKTGYMEEGDLDDISKIIQETDFNKIREKKFEGTCPTAYDGQASTFTFYANSGNEIVDTCTTQIGGVELFSKIHLLTNKALT